MVPIVRKTCLLLAALVVAALPPAVQAQTVASQMVLKGKQIWDKKRCAACHGISQVHSGPDLAGVSQRRSREWLYQWMNESQRMIETDSVARALYQEYNRLPMPNQKMSKGDVDALLAFIDAEERRANRRR